VKLKKSTAAAAIALLSLAAQSIGLAETVGYNKVTVPGNSDALVSVPFTLDAAATLTVTGVVPSTGVTVAGPLTNNQYQNLYYVRFLTGNAAGQWSTISSNTTTQLNFSVTSFVGSIANGDQFQVIRHQTLASIFPDGLEGVSFVKSNSAINNIANRRTEILIPNSTAIGINKASSASYFYLSGEWRRQSQAGNFDNTVIEPHTYVIIRNSNNATPLTFYSLGDVVSTGQLVDRVRTETSKNDVYKSAMNPLPITLAGLELGGTPAFVSSTSLINNVANRRDELLVFNNATTGINKASSASYFYFNGAWRKQGSGGANFDGEVLPAGSAILIRKYQGVSAGNADWAQSPSN